MGTIPGLHHAVDADADAAVDGAGRTAQGPGSRWREEEHAEQQGSSADGVLTGLGWGRRKRGIPLAQTAEAVSAEEVLPSLSS